MAKMTPKHMAAPNDQPRSERPRRADARRNRARILAAADEAFAAEGAAASTEAIARRAGVGIGTLFRHFPTKEALVEAIVCARLEQLVAEAERDAAALDAANAFFGFFARTIEEMVAKKAYAEMVTGGFVNVAPELRSRLTAALTTLLASAQRAGTVRKDVDVTEIMALLGGTVQATEQCSNNPVCQERILSIVLDGLRS